MKCNLSLISLALFLSLISQIAQAELLQILHTNDLHGFIEHTVFDENKGGYKNIKRIFEEQKEWAKKEKMETLTLDAGDFSEGSIFYFAQNGRRNFEMMNLLGYDAVAMGNHDWLMGSKELNQILKDVNLSFNYLASNVSINALMYPKLYKKVEKFKIVSIGNIKIGILGLTTNERFYSWRFEDGKIKKPEKVAKKYAKKLKKKYGVDYVIVLSHTGVWKDEEIIKKNSNVDLIVGGHSHTALFKPYYVKDKKGIERPIVQAGEHGNYVGKLVLELKKGKPLIIKSYRLIPVKNLHHSKVSNSKIAESQKDVAEYIKETRNILETRFDKSWLSEKMGDSLINLRSSDDHLTTWTALVTDGLKECTNADMAVHSPGFGGTDLPAGKLTREKIFQAYPRIFDVESQYGWRIYDVEIFGVFIKTIVKVVLNRRMPVAFSGITFDVRDENDDLVLTQTSGDVNDQDKVIQRKFLGLLSNYNITNIRINGEKVKWNKKYKLALPEGIVRGGLGITRLVKFIFRNISKNNYSVWECLNKKINKEQLVTFDYHKDQKSIVNKRNLRKGNQGKSIKYNNYMFVSPRIKPLEKVRHIHNH